MILKRKEDPSQLLFDFMKPPEFKFEDIRWASVGSTTATYVYNNTITSTTYIDAIDTNYYYAV